MEGVEREGYGLYLRKRRQLGMVDCTDANKNTPLSEAAAGGHHSTIIMLIEKGADVNSRFITLSLSFLITPRSGKHS